ncbi:hypothetical protein APX70_04831 [Pseudomonas syringae pv. maculicola]|uniref:Uncharacterized protein n=1 Tax=Pseudomonas syringae pv. maculicola TaxID=59511 RepID=A0A3M2V5N3_PSEYM|nr:hypothetical protein APX70_04831 [Pseudomonas syringae pv. maculicola]
MVVSLIFGKHLREEGRYGCCLPLQLSDALMIKGEAAVRRLSSSFDRVSRLLGFWASCFVGCHR